MTTKIQEIVCGDLGSTDYACFSRCGRYLAVSGAPDSTLRVIGPDGRRVRIPSARNVGVALLRTAGDDVELLYSVRRSGVIERYLLKARTRLAPLQMETGYDLHALTASANGSLVAAGDSFGNVKTWTFQGNSATPEFSRRLLESSIYSLAIGKGGAIFVATGCGRQWKLTTADGRVEGLHGVGAKWDCFTMAAREEQTGVAMAGDGNRIWLVDLPFKLNPTDDQEAADGFPRENWEMDMNDQSERWSLRKRIYLPAAGPDRCSYIDSDTGAHIAQLYFTGPRELVVVGDYGLEVWALSPLKLVHWQGHRSSPSRRIFGVVRQADCLLIAREK